MTADVKGKAMTPDVKGKTKATGAKGKTKATGLKEFLLNLATDPRKLGEFLHAPEAAMSAANLSEADKTALRSGVSGMVAARLAGVPLDQAFQPPPLLIGPVAPQSPYIGLPPQPPYIGLPPQPPYIGLPPQPPYIGLTPQPPYIGLPPQPASPPHFVVQPQFLVYPPPQFVVQPPPYYPR
jgi:hypothetical protein